jgi:hypothetical protein
MSARRAQTSSLIAIVGEVEKHAKLSFLVSHATNSGYTEFEASMYFLLVWPRSFGKPVTDDLFSIK